MQPARRSRVRTGVWVALCLGLTGCEPRTSIGGPSIAFSEVPVASEGGSDKLAPISGRVAGARAGQKIVLFAKSGVWWVQPLTVRPFTDIQADSTWKNIIHLGTEYAALLVEPGYRPPATTELLPTAGGAIIAVATMNGTGAYLPRSRKTLAFSGYDWEIRQTPSDRGGANEYDPANAWTDPDGALHLKVARTEEGWTSAEVSMTRSLGYGTYVFVVRDVSHVDPAVALSLLTWDDQGVDQNHRELDIEISQWGDPNSKGAQYVVQPYYVAANVLRFAAPAGRLTHSLRWEPGRASFKTVRGSESDARAPVVAEHDFTSGVPVPGNETVRLNLYYFRYSPTTLEREAEIVIEKFQYLP
jgi:hypothetical protein